jgi:hypothetical protein
MFVGEDDADGMALAIKRLCDPSVREAFVTQGAARASKFSFADTARQVADALVSTHHRISCGELARPNDVWHDLRETLQTSQSPKVFGVVLRQELRRRTLAALRKIGGDPPNNWLWAMARELERDPKRWTAIAGAFLRKGFEYWGWAPRQDGKRRGP